MTEQQKPSSNQNETADQYVAPLLPPTASPPESLRKRFFLTDLLFYWLVPHKRGPHLCVRSIWRALAAALIALVLATGIGLIPELLDNYDSYRLSSISTTSLDELRVQVANTILEAAEDTRYTKIPTGLFFAIGFIPGWLIAIPIIGTITMPFAASGDRPWSVWKRSVKNAYWSSTLLVPASLIYAAVFGMDRINRINMSNTPDWLALTIVIGSCVLVLLVFCLWIRALIVGAGRFVGEPDGPAWSEREPLCDDCGYRLTHLPLNSRCPECGLPVHISLPGGRRQPTLWSLNERNRRGFFELLKMQWRIIRQPDYFKRIPVQNMLGPARHFWWATYLVMVLGMLLFGLLLSGILGGYITIIEKQGLSDQPNRWMMPFVFAAALIPVPFLLTILTNFPACLWAKWRHGIYDYRVSATACFYSIPTQWLIYASLLIFISAYHLFFLSTHMEMYFLRRDYPIPTLVTWCLLLPILYSFYNWLSSLNRALFDVRFANE